MTMLGIRLSDELDARLNAESRSAGQPKSSLVRQALEQFLIRRKRERFLAGLTQAARALDPERRWKSRPRLCLWTMKPWI